MEVLYIVLAYILGVVSHAGASALWKKLQSKAQEKIDQALK